MHINATAAFLTTSWAVWVWLWSASGHSRYGNPLYLPDQQVGLNTLALPPRWDPIAASCVFLDPFFPRPFENSEPCSLLILLFATEILWTALTVFHDNLSYGSRVLRVLWQWLAFTSSTRLSCGVTVPAEKQLVRRFKVGNNSAARVVVSWKALSCWEWEWDAGKNVKQWDIMEHNGTNFQTCFRVQCLGRNVYSKCRVVMSCAFEWSDIFLGQSIWIPPLQAFPKSQLENMAEDRNMIHVALCGRSPDIKDPFIVEPKKEDPNKAEERASSIEHRWSLCFGRITPKWSPLNGSKWPTTSHNHFGPKFVVLAVLKSHFAPTTSDRRMCFSSKWRKKNRWTMRSLTQMNLSTLRFGQDHLQNPGFADIFCHDFTVYQFPLLASPSKAILDHLANLAVWIHNINHKQHPCGKIIYV